VISCKLLAISSINDIVAVESGKNEKTGIKIMTLTDTEIGGRRWQKWPPPESTSTSRKRGRSNYLLARNPYSGVLKNLEPYKTPVGNYDLVKAYKAGFDKDILKQLFGEDIVKNAEDYINMEKAFEPYRREEGGYALAQYADLTGAGITDEQISRFFGEEMLKRLKNPEPATLPEETPVETPNDKGYLPPDEDYISKIPVPQPSATPETPVENPAKATASPENLSPGDYYISQVPVHVPPEKLDNAVRDMIDEVTGLAGAGEETLITSEEAAERGIIIPDGYKVKGVWGKRRHDVQYYR
jgi:hypothetical protein